MVCDTMKIKKKRKKRFSLKMWKEMNPICRECGKEAQLMRDFDDIARWWCPNHGFRKLYELNFVVDKKLE